MAIHSSILAWRIPWTEKPDGLPTLREVAKESDATKRLNQHNSVILLQDAAWGGVMPSQILQVFTLESENHHSRCRFMPVPFSSKTLKEASFSGNHFCCAMPCFAQFLWKEAGKTQGKVGSGTTWSPAIFQWEVGAKACRFLLPSGLFQAGDDRGVSCFSSQPDMQSEPLPNPRVKMKDQSILFFQFNFYFKRKIELIYQSAFLTSGIEIFCQFFGTHLHC